MKIVIIFMVFFNFSLKAEEILKAGNYFGTGEFSCFFLNANILRPVSSHWQIRKISTNPDKFEFIGNYPIVNSQPIYFTAENSDDLNNYDLYNLDGQKKGMMKCEYAKCILKFQFQTNLIRTIRSPEVIELVWMFNDDTFIERVNFRYLYLPVVGNCNAEINYVRN